MNSFPMLGRGQEEPEPRRPSAGVKYPPHVPPGPQGGPMSQPVPNDGVRKLAMVQVEMAMQMLEQALPSLQYSSREGEVVFKALNILAEVFDRAAQQSFVPMQLSEMVRAQRQNGITQSMGGGDGAPPQLPGGAAL